jgi:hypothetical protein
MSETYEPEAPAGSETEPTGPPMSQEEWNEMRDTVAAINEAVAEGWESEQVPAEDWLPDEFAPLVEPSYDDLAPEEAEAQLRGTIAAMVHDAAAPYQDQMEAFQQRQQVAVASEAADAIVAQHSERLGVELDPEQAILDVGGAALHIVESLKADGLEPAAILAEMEKNGTVEALFKWAAENQVPSRGDEFSLVTKHFPGDGAVFQTQETAAPGDEFGLVAKYFPSKT